MKMSSDEEQISLENLMKTEMEMYKIKCEMLHQELISCKITEERNSLKVENKLLKEQNELLKEQMEQFLKIEAIER